MEGRERALDDRVRRRTAVPARSIPRAARTAAEGFLAVLPPLDPSPVDEETLDLSPAERASLSRNHIVRDVQLRAFREARRSTLADPSPEEIEAAEREAARARRDSRWDAWVPPRYRDATLDRVAGRHGDALARDLYEWSWQANPPNLILTGPIGVGKTFAVLAAVRADVCSGHRVVYWSTGRLLQELRPGGSPDVLAGLLDADVLILDDLGVEKLSEWTTEQLTIVVDDRYSNCRPIVVTTNDLGSLAGSTRDRGKSRLLDGALVLAVDGARFR